MEYKGIDVSKWQGSIDFNAVKKSGIDFVMIRASYGKGIDTNFKNNLTKAKSAGLNVGIYHYTTATTPTEAREEIQYLFKNGGFNKLEYPVAFDMEDTGAIYDRLTSQDLTNIALAGLDEIEKHGYFAILYSNPNWLEYKFKKEQLSKYDLWLAHWTNTKPTAYTYGIWQYGTTTVTGISGEVDGNISYKNYPNIMSYNGLNGFTKNVEKPVENVKTYTVQSGDSFWSIAEKEMGSGSKMYELAKANNMTINDTIYKGNVLIIPEV